MPLYDQIATSFQLGNGLQVGIGDADLFTSASRIGVATDTPFNGYQDLSPDGPQCVLCEHQGSLFAAFVETIWDGSTTFTDLGGGLVGTGPNHLAQGPYVKQYDPGTNLWQLVGDPIEPSLFEVVGDIFHVATGYSLSTGGTVQSSSFAVGTRFLPTRVRLASDGSNLYLAYAIHITRPNGSGVYSPFTYIVRRYNSATGVWDLYGQIDPVGQNDGQGSGLGGGTSALSTYSFHNIVASPNEPGVVYTSLVQSGVLAGAGTYIATVTRFDGTTLAGTAKTIGTPKTLSGSTFSVAGTVVFDLALRYDTADGPFMYWSGALDESVDASQKFFVQRWSDMAILAEFSNAPLIATPRGYEGGEVLLTVLDTNYTLREMPYDGSSVPTPIDGVIPEAVERTFGDRDSFFLPDMHNAGWVSPVLSEPPNDIWVVDPLQGSAVWLYHRPCRGWTLQRFTPAGSAHGPVTSGFQFDSDTFRVDDAFGRHFTGSNWDTEQVHDFGFFSLAVDSIIVNGVIYVIAWVGKSASPANVAKLAVYAVPIARNLNSCSAEAGLGLVTVPIFIPLGNDPAQG